MTRRRRMGALKRRYGGNRHGPEGERRFLASLAGVRGAMTVWATSHEKAVRKAQEMAERMNTYVEDVREG